MLKISFLFIMFALFYTERPMVIGHRGAKGHVAENTLASIDKALELGVDGIEIDVFRIKSGELVVFHDEKLDRLTNGRGHLVDMTLEELREVRVGSKHPIPTLEQVLQKVNNRVLLNIELKGSGTAKPVFELIQRYITPEGWQYKNLLISSFKWDELEVYRDLDPMMPIGVLTEKTISPAIEKARALGAVAVNADHHLLTENTVREIRNANLQVWCWTVNRLPDMERMLDLKIDAIITDFPDRLLD